MTEVEKPQRLKFIGGLLPCPFCGNAATLRVHSLPVGIRTKSQGKLISKALVACPQCDARGPGVIYGLTDGSGNAKQEAELLWNTRA